MIGDKESVQLSEYCFSLCEALETAVQGKNEDDLNTSVRAALESSKRCVNWPWPVSSLTNQLQGYMRNRAEPQEGGEHATRYA
jgi:hypothetical protein